MVLCYSSSGKIIYQSLSVVSCWPVGHSEAGVAWPTLVSESPFCWALSLPSWPLCRHAVLGWSMTRTDWHHVAKSFCLLCCSVPFQWWPWTSNSHLVPTLIGHPSTGLCHRLACLFSPSPFLSGSLTRHDTIGHCMEIYAYSLLGTFPCTQCESLNILLTALMGRFPFLLFFKATPICICNAATIHFRLAPMNWDNASINQLRCFPYLSARCRVPSCSHECKPGKGTGATLGDMRGLSYLQPVLSCLSSMQVYSFHLMMNGLS